MNSLAKPNYTVNALIDALCDRFEESWDRGERPSVEAYLGETAGPVRSSLIRSLLSVEWEQRQLRGETLDTDDYLRRFPDCERWIRELERRPRPEPATLDRTRGMEGSDDIDGVGQSGDASRFDIVREHARGGLGLVSIALDRQIGREVALKELQPAWSGLAENRARFLREARITGGLEHPAIVPVYALGTREDGRPYYAMKLVRGETLKDAIKTLHADRGPVDRGELRRLLRRLIDVCHAVQFAHDRGILHRDIKPENILLGKYGETMLVDWGLARWVSEQEPDEQAARLASSAADTDKIAATREGSVVGTPGYMAPEQAAGNLSRLGPPCDIYGLGATLYCLLVGHAPHAADTHRESVEKSLQGKVEAPRHHAPWIPRPLEAICLKAMAWQPEDRYATARDLLDDLERWISDEAVTAGRESLAARLSRWSRRNRSLVRAALASLVLISIVSTVAACLVLRSRNQEAAARQTAQDHLQRADRSLIASLSAIERMLTRVGSERLTILPNSERIRLHLLEDAQDLLNSLLDSQRDVPELEMESATVAFRLAQMAAWLGDRPRIEQTTNQALGLLGTAPNTAEDVQRQLLRAQIHHLRAIQLYGIQRPREMTTAVESARESFSRLPERIRERGATRHMRARLAREYGEVLRELGDVELALAELRKAASLLGDSPSDSAGDRAWHYDYARTHHRLGLAYETVGQRDKANPHYRLALNASEQLLTDSAPYPDERQLLADVCGDFGWHQWTRGEPESAERMIRRAVDINRQLTQDYSQVPHYRAAHATSLARLAWFLHQVPLGIQQDHDEFLRGRASSIQETYEEALSLLHALREDDPENVSHLQLLSNTCTNYATASVTLGEIDRATRLMDQAVELRRLTLEKFGATPDRWSALAASLHNLADVQGGQGDLDGALANLREALQLENRAIAANPDHPIYRAFLRNHHWLIARIHALRGESRQAEDAFRLALEIARELFEEYGREGNYHAFYNSVALHYAQLLATTDDDEVQDVQQAYRLLQGCESRSPTWPSYPLHAAWMLCELDELAGAEAALERGRSLLHSPDPLADLVESRLALGREDNETAESAMQRAAESMGRGGDARDTTTAYEQRCWQKMLDDVRTRIDAEKEASPAGGGLG